MGRVDSTRRALHTTEAYSACSRAKILEKVLLVLVLLFSLFPAPLSAVADELYQKPSSKTIRVACYGNGNHMSLDENGTYSGFAVDYLERVSYYAEWDFEYVRYDTFLEGYEAVCRGDADIMSSIYRTPEREGDILFSDSPMCQTHTALCVREDNVQYGYEDFDAYQGMKVGVVRGILNTDLFLEYLEKNDLDVEVCYFDTTPELLAALDEDTIDAIATTYLGSDYPLRVLSRFSPAYMHFAVSPDRDDIKQALDEAMDAMAMRDSVYVTDLYDEYFGFNTALDPVFTAQEKAYFQEAPTIRVAFASKNPPLSYVDEKTGEFAGAFAQLFRDIARVTGLEFDYIAVGTQQQAIDAVNEGEADIVCGVDTRLSVLPQNSMNLTGSYLRASIAQVAKNGAEEVESAPIAVVESFLVTEKIKKTNPNSEIKYFADPESCLEAVLSGEVGSAYLESNVMNYLLTTSRYSSLRNLGLIGASKELCLGVSAESNHRLLTALDRCVRYVGEPQFAQWAAEASVKDQAINLPNLLREYPLQAFLAVVLLLVIIFGAVFYVVVVKARSRAKIDEINYGDPLTGGWKLSLFQVEVEKLLRNSDKRYGLIYFDIVQFKGFNASFGFVEGDRLLVAIHDYMKEYAEGDDCYARVTADEFILLAEWRGEKEMHQRFEAFNMEINELEVLQEKGYRIQLRGGMYAIKDNSKVARSDIIEYIDLARYARDAVKEASHSAILLYNEKMKEKDLADRHLINEAEQALVRGEFVVHYQPKVEIESGKIVGFEALVRWDSPKRGFLFPGAFISLFEKSNLIFDLDLYVLDHICQSIRSRLDEEKPIVPISCNFSRRHFERNDFSEKIRDIAEKYGVPPKYIELEITESIFVEDTERLQVVCAKLQGYGFRISIDDFGSGYSSLGMLQDLPFQVLKIDRSLLLHSEEGDHSKSVLEATIQIAEKFGVGIVAEGVETLHQAHMLQTLDKKIIAQGFLYSPAVDPNDSADQLDKGFLSPKAE